MKLIIKCIVGLLLVGVFNPFEAVAHDITLTATADNVYELRTAGFTANNHGPAAAIDLIIGYDRATLSAPVIVNGPVVTSIGAISIPNDDANGVLRDVFVTITNAFFNGDGLLATITFTRTGAVSSRAPTLRSSVFDGNGVQLGSQAFVNQFVNTNPIPKPVNGACGSSGGSAFSAAPSSNLCSSGTASAVSGNGPWSWSCAGTDGGENAVCSATKSVDGSFGAVAPSEVVQQQPLQSTTSTPLPQPTDDEKPPTDDVKPENPVDSPPPPNQQDAPLPPVAEPSEAVTDAAVNDISNKTVSVSVNLHSIRAVLARFREYEGLRTLKGFAALFDGDEAKTAGIVQSPSIVVSDGKAIMAVAIELSNVTDTPSFSLKGANQKSVRQISESKWELNVLPQKGKSDVRLSIILNGKRTEIPLVVVPPLNRDAAHRMDVLSVAELNRLLANPLKNNKPAYDLNSDGKQDYIDDYILIAHWLLKQQRNASEAELKRKPAMPVNNGSSKQK